MKKIFEDDKHKEKILDRIQKMLNVAGGTKFEKEADTAMKTAQSYMKQYGVNLSDVQLANAPEGEIIEINLDEHSKRANPKNWEVVLSITVAKVFNCRTYVLHYGGRSKMIFVGYEDDVVFAKLVFNTLYISSRASSYKAFEGSTVRQRLSFLYGCSCRLLDRADEEKQKAENEPTGRYALAVRKKQDLINNFLKNKNLKEKGYEGHFIDTDAYKRGKRHANKMDLMNKEKVKKVKPKL